MKKVKFKIASGDTTMQSYCPTTGAAWTFMSEDGLLLNYLEAVKIKDSLGLGPFGDVIDITMIEVPKGPSMRNEWVDYKDKGRDIDRNGLRLALIAKGRALDKYEDKWDLLSEEIRNALVLSEVALIIADQDHDENFGCAAAVVQNSLIDLGY